MFLLTQIRDPHTANWIENMANATNLLEYHGSGAFNLTRYPDWDSIFVDMIDRPRSKIILQAKRRGRGHGGWSKHNPYLKVRTYINTSYPHLLFIIDTIMMKCTTCIFVSFNVILISFVFVFVSIFI